jgi:hypothetical protein
MKNAIMTVAEFQELTAKVWAQSWWSANSLCYDLFIDGQMNDGIDIHNETSFRQEVRI